MKKRQLLYFLAMLATTIASGAEKVDGLFGIKFGSRPEALRVFTEFKPIGAQLVLVSPDEAGAPDCLALLDRDGKVVQVQCFIAGPGGKSRQSVLKELREKHGEPLISGTAEVNGGKVEFDTFFSDGAALCCEASAKMLVVECTDVAAMTNLLANAKPARNVRERRKLELMGRKIGYSMTLRKPDKMFEIGSTDHVWRLRHGREDLLIVSDGKDMWSRRGDNWQNRPGRLIGGQLSGNKAFLANLDENAENGISVWLCDAIGKKESPIKTEVMPSAAADTPADERFFEIWEKVSNPGETIRINRDGTIKWNGHIDEIADWRWRSRCGCLMALPSDFGPSCESYGGMVRAMSLSQDGKLQVSRRGVFRKKTPDRTQ